MSALRRLAAALALTGLLWLFGGAAASGTPTTSGCTGYSGVTVVVDFGDLGGGTQARCAPGDPDSGLEALSAAGFSYGFVQTQPGLVCTIDHKPDPCNGAPADAYWAYYQGEPDGSWTYSKTGAGSSDPDPGDVEGWAFGAGDEPSIPAPAAAPTTTKDTTTTATTQPRAPTTTAAVAVPPPAPADPAAASTTTTAQDAPVTTTSTTTTTRVPRSTTTDEPGSDEERAGQVRVEEEDGRGSNAGTVAAGVAAVTAIAGAALWETRRRIGT